MYIVQILVRTLWIITKRGRFICGGFPPLSPMVLRFSAVFEKISYSSIDNTDKICYNIIISKFLRGSEREWA